MGKISTQTISLIRRAKQSHTDILNDKLQSNNLYSDWWTALKYFIFSLKTLGIRLLNSDGNLIITDPTEKANTINNYFRDQSLMDDNNVEVPPTQFSTLLSELNIIILTSDEIKFVLKSL